MIKVTLSDKTEVYLNEDHILKIEQQPFQTVIFLSNEKKVIVKEEAVELIKRIKHYKHEIFKGNFEVSQHEE